MRWPDSEWATGCQPVLGGVGGAGGRGWWLFCDKGIWIWGPQTSAWIQALPLWSGILGGHLCDRPHSPGQFGPQPDPCEELTLARREEPQPGMIGGKG